jgi:hypothetical protein
MFEAKDLNEIIFKLDIGRDFNIALIDTHFIKHLKIVQLKSALLV